VRFAALLVAVITIVVDMVGFFSPESVTTARRALGAAMCLQALAATLLGPDRARAVLEWEAMQTTALLRVGAAVALAIGCFLAFAVSGHRPTLRAKRTSPMPGDPKAAHGPFREPLLYNWPQPVSARGSRLPLTTVGFLSGY